MAQRLQQSDMRTSSDWTRSPQRSPAVVCNVHHFRSSSNQFYSQWGGSALWKEAAACSTYNLSASYWLHISSYYNHALVLVWKHNFLKAGDLLNILLPWHVLWTMTDFITWNWNDAGFQQETDARAAELWLCSCLYVTVPTYMWVRVCLHDVQCMCVHSHTALDNHKPVSVQGRMLIFW